MPGVSGRRAGNLASGWSCRRAPGPGCGRLLQPATTPGDFELISKRKRFHVRPSTGRSGEPAMRIASPLQWGKSRPPVCAGRFYPANPGELCAAVQGLIAAAKVAEEPAPKAIIAPHAGYVYSGPVAASAHSRFLPARDVIRRVILVGPSHHCSLCRIAASSVDAFFTPLGPVPLDREAIAQVASLP